MPMSWQVGMKGRLERRQGPHKQGLVTDKGGPWRNFSQWVVEGRCDLI